MFRKMTFAALAAVAVLTFNSSISSSQVHSLEEEREQPSIATEGKNTWKEWKLKNLQLEKQMLTKQIEWNWLTLEDAKGRLQQFVSWAESDALPNTKEPSLGNSKKIEKLPATQIKKITKLTYQTNLTPEQKSELQNWRKEKSNLKKDLVRQKLNWGWLSEKQASLFIKELNHWDSKDIFEKQLKL